MACFETVLQRMDLIQQQVDLLYRMQCEQGARLAALEGELFQLRQQVAPRSAGAGAAPATAPAPAPPQD